MGCDMYCWSKLCKHAGPGKKLLSLGYPDLLVTEAKLLESLGDLPSEAKDSAVLAKWHAWPGRIYNADEAIRGLGYEPLYVDYKKIRGPEEIANLNRPCAFGRTFDVICDFGTTEHIFNVASAFANIKNHSHHGTVVLHSNPINKPNHGFFSFSPTFFVDMWEANEGRIRELVLYSMNGAVFEGVTAHRESWTTRFKVDKELQIGVEVELIRPQAGFLFPIQSKYREAK